MKGKSDKISGEMYEETWGNCPKMNAKQGPFWKTISLDGMTREEWESLCDRCGICCLEKIEDSLTGKIELTSIACQFLDTVKCGCLIYEDRKIVKPDCFELSPDKLKQIKWLPDTCAYRRVAEGKDLEWWHPLISGDPGTVHQAGISIRDKVVSGQYLHPKVFRNSKSHMVFKKK